MGCSFSLKKIFAWSLGAAEKNKKPKIKQKIFPEIFKNPHRQFRFEKYISQRRSFVVVFFSLLGTTDDAWNPLSSCNSVHYYISFFQRILHSILFRVKEKDEYVRRIINQLSSSSGPFCYQLIFSLFLDGHSVNPQLLGRSGEKVVLLHLDDYSVENVRPT